MAPHSAYVAAPHVVHVAQGDRAVLLDHRRGEYFSLNATGTRIWESVREGLAVSAIVDRLAEEFDAPRDVLEADARALLAQMEARGLVASDR
jgi:PqqD family protein of HPr-rel-A system